MTSKKKYTIAWVLIIAAICWMGCFSHWTEKERREFNEKCTATDSTDNITFQMVGFSYEEIEPLLIRHLRNGSQADSFYVHFSRYRYDSVRSTYSEATDTRFCVNDTYQFVVKNAPPFVLADMKMVMWAQYTMGGEGYGCVMGDYTINGVRYQDANPSFIKPGFRYPWEKADSAEVGKKNKK